MVPGTLPVSVRAASRKPASLTVAWRRYSMSVFYPAIFVASNHVQSADKEMIERML